RFVEQRAELRFVEVERWCEARQTSPHHFGGAQAIRHVERKVTHLRRARSFSKRAETAHQDGVGLEILQVAIDLLFARFANARRGDADESRAFVSKSTERRASARELEEIEPHSIGARGQGGARLIEVATQDEEATRKRPLGCRDLRLRDEI